MRAWDYTLIVPNRPGSVATIGEELGRAGVNIEGISAFVYRGQGIVHILVADRATAGAIFERFASVGFQVQSLREVIVEELDDAPGSLGDASQKIADQGINLTSLYVATGSRVVMGSDDIEALERAWSAMKAARV